MPGCSNQPSSSKPDTAAHEPTKLDATTQETDAGSKTQTLVKELSVDLGKGVKLEMVLIPAGQFLMGSPESDKDDRTDEKPQHLERITKPFYLGRYKVTQEQWEAVMGSNPSKFKGPKNPVDDVSWDDCQEFFNKLNVKTGPGDGKFQLPTEAQWEYACRAGSKTRYCFGDDESGLGEYAWYGKNSGNKTHPVGGKKPNAWGLCDMYGNMWEWCADWYDEYLRYYAHSPTDDPTGPRVMPRRVHDVGEPTDPIRVYRGGSWLNAAGSCRSALRGCNYSGLRDGFVGLRASLVPVNLAFVSAQEPKAAGKAKSPPKKLALDLGKGVKLDLILIPAGEFLMGSPDSDKYAVKWEKPQHRVRITRPFYLGKYKVTQEQWEAVMGSNPSFPKGPKNPVDAVSWDDCQEFFDKLSAEMGPGIGKFQLPTEAQWEYACRAGSTTRYCFGDDEAGLGEYAWFGTGQGLTGHPVGQKKPNAWGLYDMHGNVSEWCADWFDTFDFTYYAYSPTDDPTGPPTGTRRVYRGGSSSDHAARCRSANRTYELSGARGGELGFRAAVVPADK
jgi:formylglycine-generating enzyme required for sulfatase activity